MSLDRHDGRAAIGLSCMHEEGVAHGYPSSFSDPGGPRDSRRKERLRMAFGCSTMIALALRGSVTIDPAAQQQIRATVDAQLLKDVLQVNLCGLLGDVQRSRDLFVRLTDQTLLQHSIFLRSQDGQITDRALRARDIGGEAREDLRGLTAAEPIFSAADRGDRTRDVAARARTTQVAGHSEPQHFPPSRGIECIADDQHARARRDVMNIGNC